jgi:hypothetical protein
MLTAIKLSVIMQNVMLSAITQNTFMLSIITLMLCVVMLSAVIPGITMMLPVIILSVFKLDVVMLMLWRHKLHRKEVLWHWPLICHVTEPGHYKM